MSLPITLDPLECKNLIRHLNGTDNKILNNLNYNKTFTLLEDHYFQEQLERFQTPFTVYQFNKMYTGTFTYMPADKTWIYDPLRNPYHNCPAHNQFEVNLVSWRLAISEIELTYDDTQNVMIIDGHTLPCYFADGFCKPTTKTPFTLVWFSDDFCLIFTLQDFIGRMTKIDDRYWIETDSFVHSATPKNHLPLMVSKVLLILTFVLLILKLHITQGFLVLKSFLRLTPFVENLNLYILLNILTFLLLTLKDLTCIQDNQTPLL